ncbi:hypothetical protein BDP27DRAFT_1450075 [Rhodocollybia butyracea]|uniref:Uncharacterized protein n=1 Tax=Rhodocollybia butyracea TaxID=206335 RepID=A0A9P5PMC3_9AGAR|nr:hypothetical protein BDP27DRAFT_1450075 [Rhodocollybia butyracea]
MAPLRAYRLPADSTSAIDESQSVSVEQLGAVGWKITPVAGGQDEVEQACEKMAQESGYPITQEGCKVPFHLDVEKHAATLDPGVITVESPQKRSLTRADFSWLTYCRKLRNHISLANEAFIIVTGDSVYTIDVEDVTSASWIRFHLVPGMILHVPTGGRYRVAFDEQNRKVTGFGYFKETVSNHGLLVKDEIDTHPARHAYLSTRQT